MVKNIGLLPAVFLMALLASCVSGKPTTKPDTTVTPPVSKPEIKPALPVADREFRAAWVATVANINWPSKPGLSTEQQQAEAIALLDFLKANHFNAVVFQVRPQADALYKSDIEPWSYFLSGVQGKAPEPYYDPLEFWINAAHDRGLELHAWLNPYRSHHISGGAVTESSIVKKKPGLSVFLKEGYWWFDPSLKETQDHSASVVRDIVRRYDVDGIHFDDYFYPYPSYNKGEDFPDSTSWKAYQRSGGKLSRGDWRRESVNQFINRLYSEIKNEKQHVKFGLSPFGIWRPGYPESISGFDQHDVLYADARLWLNKGWIDYFAPQLYWPINRMPQSFPVLLGWWAGENKMGRHLWPGINVGRDTAYKSVNETLSQIMISRGMLPASKGVIHWSISSVTLNPVLAKALVDGPYKREALVPSSPWLDNQAPAAPMVAAAVAGDSIRVNWSHAAAADVFKWVVYFRHGDNWNYKVLDRNERSFLVPASVMNGKLAMALRSISVTAVDRTGNENLPEILDGTWK